MKKALKVNKTLIVLGLIVVVSLISFLGLYSKTNGVWSNILPSYSLGMELDGYRELVFTLDTTEEEKEAYVDEEGNILGFVDDGTVVSENVGIQLVPDDESEENVQADEVVAEEYTKESVTVKANEESDITIDNFKLSKEIIQKRLNSINNLEYNIRLDNVTGDLVVEVPDNDYVSTVDALVDSIGKFDIIDYETGIVLLDNSDLSGVTAVANTTEEGYQLYLQISTNESGKQKMSEISTTYVATTNEAGESSTKYVSVRFEGDTLVSTYFGEEITNGVLTVPIGNTTSDSGEYAKLAEQATRIAYILNEGELPLQYQLVSDNLINPLVTEEMIFILEIVVALAILIVSAILIAKYKLNGLILSIVSVGYLAVAAFAIRFADVTVTLNSIYTILLCDILNYVFIFKLLNKMKDSELNVAFKETLKDYYKMIIPASVIAIIFTFATTVAVNSIGMTLFWGIIMGLVYNTLIIRLLRIV